MKKEKYNLLIIDTSSLVGVGLATIAKQTGLFSEIQQINPTAAMHELLSSKGKYDIIIFTEITKESLKTIELIQEEHTDTYCIGMSSGNTYTETDYPFNEVIPQNATIDEWKRLFETLTEGGIAEKGNEILGKNNSHTQVQSIHKDDLPTRRELEVLQAMSEGYSSISIAQKMNISENTVETFRKRLMLKFDARNSVDLIVKSIKRGWIKI